MKVIIEIDIDNSFESDMSENTLISGIDNIISDAIVMHHNEYPSVKYINNYEIIVQKD